MARGCLRAAVTGIGSEQTDARTPGAGPPEAPLLPQRPSPPELRSLHRNAAGSVLSEPSCGRPGLLRSARAREPEGSANQLRAPRASRGRAGGCRPSPALGRGRCSPTTWPSGRGMQETRNSPRSPGDTAANLLRGGYVTFHRGHCGCQEEQQQAVQGHRRPAVPRPSPSRGGRGGRAPRLGVPLRSPPVASPYPFALWPGPDSPERDVGVGGIVRAWGGAGARGCGCACVCVCLWERWVCACVCVRERARECEPGRARECVFVLVSHCELQPSLLED